MNFSTAELVIIETKARDTFSLVNVDTGTTLGRDAKFLKHASSQHIGNDIDVDISAKTEESIDHSVKRNDPIKITTVITVSSTKALVHAFVTCRLDNCNYLLYGLPKHLVHRLQLAQNCAARLILCGRKHDHVTPLLRELHWLPVEQRIICKILFFTFKALNNLCPSYISDLLETYKPTRSLRSSSRNLLVIPRSKLKSYGDRAFSVSAPKCGMTFLKP